MLHRKGNRVDVEALLIESPSGRMSEKAPRWYLMGTEGCGGANRVSWCSRMFSGYMSIYRRKKSVRGATRGPRWWRARLPASWPACCFLDIHSKSPGLRLFQKRSSRRFRSVWTPSGIAFLQNSKIGKKTESGTGPSVNRLVPKII